MLGEVSRLFLSGGIFFSLALLKIFFLRPTNFLHIVSRWSTFSTWEQTEQLGVLDALKRKR